MKKYIIIGLILLLIGGYVGWNIRPIPHLVGSDTTSTRTYIPQPEVTGTTGIRNSSPSSIQPRRDISVRSGDTSLTTVKKYLLDSLYAENGNLRDTLEFLKMPVEAGTISDSTGMSLDVTYYPIRHLYGLGDPYVYIFQPPPIIVDSIRITDTIEQTPPFFKGFFVRAEVGDRWGNDLWGLKDKEIDGAAGMSFQVDRTHVDLVPLYVSGITKIVYRKIIITFYLPL